MPGNIKGLVGSCLVIPCTFDYYSNPPRRPDRVVWYQYANHKYPIVYDDWYPSDVIGIFYGKTRVFNFNKKCSLQIYPVTWHHHRQRIYPWVDPENIGRYTHRFFDKTVTIEVVSSFSPLTISHTSDEFLEGQASKVICTASYTCPKHIPTLTWNYGTMPASTDTSKRGNTEWRSVSTLTFTASAKDHGRSLTCSAQFTGGQRQEKSITLQVKNEYK
ncbi:sialoadhesin-like [Anarrhichthys ocellatus]|uniref:sialoadhesin-like n=1 Tax=Anarrhichthys ocellatus TaxID=433405 RepID=UPI0012EE58C7|nr:sialoadhesin-like [Anarrhichthys ocellatus]